MFADNAKHVNELLTKRESNVLQTDVETTGVVRHIVNEFNRDRMMNMEKGGNRA